MTLAYKRLGSAVVVAITNTALYTVPASTTTVAQFIATNTSQTNATFRFAIIVNAGISSVSAGDYLVYDRTLVPGEVFSLSGLTMNAGDTMMVQSNVAGGGGTGLNFQAYGEEQS